MYIPAGHAWDWRGKETIDIRHRAGGPEPHTQTLPPQKYRQCAQPSLAHSSLDVEPLKRRAGYEILERQAVVIERNAIDIEQHALGADQVEL